MYISFSQKKWEIRTDDKCSLPAEGKQRSELVSLECAAACHLTGTTQEVIM